MSSLTLSPPSTQTLPDEFADALLNIFEFSEEEIELAVLEPQTEAAALVERYAKYIDDPVGFTKDVLQVELVPKQQEALRALIEPPYRALCPSGNTLGKSLMAACAVLWWFCTRSPCKIITTAPTKDEVELVLWSEIRTLAERAELNLDFMPRASKIWRASNDFAIGTTARSEEAFKGKHGPNQFFVFDEANAVDPEFWDAVETMFQPPGHAWLCLFNPRNTSSRAFDEMNSTLRGRKGKHEWHVVRMSAIDHPNIAAELKGEKAPIPDAVRIDWFERILYKNSQLVGCPVDDPHKATLPTDILWPPIDAKDYCERTGQRPRWWRPGPKADVMLFGRFPRQGTNSVWSDGDWLAALREGLDPLPLQLWIPEIGCDVAAQGDDNTAIHVRAGYSSLDHEEGNGWTGPQIMRKLKDIADYYAQWYNDENAKLPLAQRMEKILPTDIPIKIDCDGIGTRDSEYMENEGYTVIRVGAGTKALDEKEFPNRRSELWFTTAEMARVDELDLSRLSAEVQDDCRRQFLSVTWSLDSRGRRVVMPKDEMRKLMGRSPDTADAINLSYAGFTGGSDSMGEILYSRQDPLGRKR